MKVALERRNFDPFGYLHGRRPALVITQALPFFRSGCGTYIHRVRSGRIHQDDKGEYSHTHVEYWCGGAGFVGPARRNMRHTRKYGQFFSEPPDRAVFCATCEGRAIGAGMDGARVIAGRTVMFSARI